MAARKLTSRELNVLCHKMHTVGLTADEDEAYFVQIYEWERATPLYNIKCVEEEELSIDTFDMVEYILDHYEN